MEKRGNPPSESDLPEDDSDEFDFEETDDGDDSVKEEKSQKELDREALLDTPYIINGFDTDLTVWDRESLEHSLQHTYETQISVEKSFSTLIYDDSGTGISLSYTEEFAAKMATILGLHEAPKKWGQVTQYLDLGKLSEHQLDELITENKPEDYYIFYNIDANTYKPTEYYDLSESFLTFKVARGILFFDHLNHADRDASNHLFFNAVAHHRFGSTEFSFAVLVVASANLVSKDGNVPDILPELQNWLTCAGALIPDDDPEYLSKLTKMSAAAADSPSKLP